LETEREHLPSLCTETAQKIKIRLRVARQGRKEDVAAASETIQQKIAISITHFIIK